MATITTILGSDSPADSRTDINDNFTAVNVELVAATSAVAGKEASGTAAAAIATHVGLSDPHAQYALESDMTSALAAKAPTASPTFTGPITSSGAVVSAGTAMSGVEVNVALRDNLYSATGNATWTHSATPAVGQEYGVIVTTDGTARTITYPVTVFSQARGADITSSTFPANSTNKIIVRRTASGYTILGDPLTLAQIQALLALTSSAISDFNSATRAQVESELVAGSNITITPGSSGATRTLTIASTGGGGGGGTFSIDDGDATADPATIGSFDDGDATTT